MFKLHDHGTPDYDMVAYNYRLSDIQGAVGVAQMHKLDLILRERQRLADEYTHSFYGNDFCIPPEVPGYSNHTYQSYIAWVEDRDKMSQELEKKGIIARRGTLDVSNLPFYKKKYGDSRCTFSKEADKHTITLPLYVDMTEGEQHKVIEEVYELL
jgi:dTDP-4-amino-4,6-dideoxygalactose transaminase